MAKTAKPYMIPVYAVLVKLQIREIESLPEEYVAPVAEYLAAKEEGTTTQPASSNASGSSSSSTSTSTPASSGSDTAASTSSSTK